MNPADQAAALPSTWHVFAREVRWGYAVERFCGAFEAFADAVALARNISPGGGSGELACIVREVPTLVLVRP